MAQKQKHIINKVVLEVNTNSSNTANNLKNSLGMLLQKSILPQLEEYLNNLPKAYLTDIFQISNLNLEINTRSDDDFKTLKTDVKEKLLQKISAILKAPSEVNEEVTIINNVQSKTRSLLFFIENGYTPWWKSNEQPLIFNTNEITKIVTVPLFANKCCTLLQKSVCRKRCIQQFTNEELQILLKTVFKNNKEILLIEDKVVTAITKTSPHQYLLIWEAIINYLLSKNTTVFLENIIYILKKEQQSLVLANTVLSLLLQVSKTAKNDIIKALNKQYRYSPKNTNTLLQELIEIYNSHNLSKSFYNDIIAKSSLKQQVYFFNEKLKIVQGKTITELPNTKEEKKEAQKTKNQQSHKDQIATKNAISPTPNQKLTNKTTGTKEKKDLESQIKRDTTQKVIQKQAVDIIKNTSKTIENKESTTTNNRIAKKPKDQKETTTLSIDDTVNQDPKKNELLDNKKTVIASDYYIQNKEHINNRFRDFYEQPKQEIIENAGTYYVPNAGLIILHPYLKHFLKNCDLLDDTNTIKNPAMAVHALHYLATKKELQSENNMVFEKFLCGIPIQKPIQRHIQLSDVLKNQAEDLLQSIIKNWKALGNASTDLIRHEFLQREGKLSFKEANPKLVIERKTQDILVDKLPWGIGICKLPWLDQMIFTNW